MDDNDLNALMERIMAIVAEGSIFTQAGVNQLEKDIRNEIDDTLTELGIMVYKRPS